MEELIQKERGTRAADEVLELNLDNCNASQISGLTDEFANLEYLSLINCGLTTLKGFPTLPKLKRLELSDNKLQDGLQFLQGCPHLQYLNLSGNKIKDLESLEPLKKLSTLRSIDLFNCEVTNIDGYREKVFEQLPSLLYLDGYDQKNEEAEEDFDGEDDEYGVEGSEDDVGSEEDGEGESEDYGDGEDDQGKEEGGDEEDDEVPRGQKRKHADDEDA